MLGVLADGATRLRPLADDDRYVRKRAAQGQPLRRRGLRQARAGSTGCSRYAALVSDLERRPEPERRGHRPRPQGTVLTGYVDTVAIDQAIADARRDSIRPDVTDPYLRKLNPVCSRSSTRASTAGR